MSLIIPLQPKPSQTFRVLLGGQNTQLTIYQKDDLMYCDIALAGVPLKYMQMIRDRVLLVRQAYLGYVGDLAFMDTYSQPGFGSDPQWQGLGSRYQLVYLAPGEYVQP